MRGARGRAGLVVLPALAGIAVSLWPVWDHLRAGREARQALALARERTGGARAEIDAPLRCDPQAAEALLRVAERSPDLASWGNVGGCGVGGAGGSGGGAKWIGRGVTGGLVDVQCLSGHTSFQDGFSSTSITTRLGTGLGYKWLLGLTVPFLYNTGDVDVYGVTRPAALPGWGDLGLDVTRKLGISNASTLSFSATLPTGSHDAVRQGVVLPQVMQLSAGVPTSSLTFEHTRDHNWGLVILGGSASYGGWENAIGDMRASSASGYAFAGYLLGPLVPSAGLTLTGKIGRDRERYVPVANQAVWLATLHVGTEWSTDTVAVLLAANLPFTIEGLESANLTLGLQLSVF